MKVALTHNLKRSPDEAEAEFDTPETIQALCAAVAAAGHQAIPVEVTGPPAEWMRRLQDCRPDVVLNTAEGTSGTARTAFFPALFAALNLRFTGSDARTQMLTQDKHLTKLRVAAEGVPVARGDFHTARLPGPADFVAPVVIKPNFEGSSKGITAASVVTEPAQLAVAVARALAAYPDGVLVEEYIPGTDVTVGFFEGLGREILTPCSYVIAPEWANCHRLYDFRLKNIAPDAAVQVACPARVSADALAQVRTSARKAVRALGLRGVARLDFRVHDDGRVFFVEVNATPSLEPGSSIFSALQAEGVDFHGAIRHLIDQACHPRP